MRNFILLFLPIFTFNAVSEAWQRWNYTAKPHTADQSILFKTWVEIWGQKNALGNLTYEGMRKRGPSPRRGHSLVVIGTYLVLFGGRDDDVLQESHIPKTYNVVKVNGTLEFTTYDKKPVTACLDTAGEYYSVEERSSCKGNEKEISVAKIYNDVWAYNMECDRLVDLPCKNSGWEIWNTGALQGGCAMELGIQICPMPSERWNHGAVYFEDGVMYVYGGFSQRCDDYCDDLWMFDIYLKEWQQVNKTGELTHSGPAKRWRFSMLQDETVETTANGDKYQSFYVFGGHRLWEGFQPNNNQDNRWSNYTVKGGYLDDFWVFRKKLDVTTTVGKGFRLSPGTWTKISAVEVCFASPGVAWSERNDQTCGTTWPSPRAGHAAALDNDRNLMWLFGGYTTYFPYLASNGPGAGPGVQSSSETGYVPYPRYPFYLNDIWFYNFSSLLWTQVTFADSDPQPEPRFDHILLLRGDILFMHGGQGDNYIYDDTWYFNLTVFRWLKKSRGVYPIYPANCTDDIAFINDTANNCTHLDWPKHLERDRFYPFEILPAKDQSYYYPDTTYGPYWGIVNKDFKRNDHTALSLSNYPPDYTPLVPYAAMGPMQYARKFVYSNGSRNGTLYQWCTSVRGEPTRGKLSDGLFGRASGRILIDQPRKRNPDWDGCRDRWDGRTDLPQGLQYVKPLARADHRAVLYKGPNGPNLPGTDDQILFYGGIAFLGEHPSLINTTHVTAVSDEMWYFRFDICINDCSGHGFCHYAFCHCWDGYYGVDCSNISCPGTFCHYDDFSHEQTCYHGCQAGYNHTDADVYVQDIRKVPCSLEVYGMESNGICDGFGTAQCAPPFVGEDCSTKDCKSNCSFNGWCSIEYPVSRCLCNPGYFGEICELKECLNNCSYPNGACDHDTGVCNCNMMYSPYNNKREFHPWGGEDCSYLFAYAAAPLVSPMSAGTVLIGLLGTLFLWIHSL